MKYGYARVSTEGQDLAAQLERLKAAGCIRIFHEKRSGKNADRAQLQRMLGSLSPGDTVFAVNADRIARDPLDMLTVVNKVKAAGASVVLLDEPFIDTTSEMSDLVMFVIGWAAKWNRKRILENTAGGRMRAKARGVRFGRKPKLTEQQRGEARARLAAGEARQDVAVAFRVSYRTIERLS